MKKLESLLGDLIEFTKTLFYLHDLEGQFLFLNRRAIEFLGCGKETLLKMNVRDFLAPEMRDRFDDYLLDIKEKGFSRGLMSIQTASGDKRIIEYDSIFLKKISDLSVVSGVAHDVTDLIETKRRLKQLSQQLSLILESMPIVSYTLRGDKDYLPSFITHNIKEVTGFGHDDFMTKPFFGPEQIHPEDSPKIFANLPKLFEKGHQEYQYRRKVADGSYKWFYDHLRLIKSSEDKKYIVGMMQDITERKKAEEEIRKSYDIQTVINSLLRLSLENIPLEEILGDALDLILSLPWLAFESRGGIFLIEDEPNLLIMKAQKGLSPPIQETCKKVPLGRCICGRAALSRKIQFSSGLNEFHEISYEGMTPHGHYCVPILSADKLLGVINVYIREGHPYDPKEEEFLVAVANTLAGIIIRKQTEEALIKAVQQWKTTFDSISDFVSLLDFHGRILRCNKAMKDFLGKPFHEILHRSCWELILGTSEPMENSPFLKMKETLQHETTLISLKDHWFNVSVDPIVDQSGSLIGAVSIFSDITEQKKAEERMKSLQEQLLQSQKMEAIGQLAGGVAHDFNNLLTVINGYSDLILEELDEKSRFFQDMKEIKKASEHAASLTRQLLAFSRRQLLQPKIIDINSLIQNIEKMLWRMIGEDIQMETFLSEGLGRVKADPGQIEQVIFNLVINARDAMPRGGRLIIKTQNVELDDTYARSHIDALPGRYVMISISDNGVGMSKEVMDHIFEPFFTTKEKGKGTGLGLSTVYGIIKQSDGNIWVNSEPGKGTIFKIYLPQLEKDDESIEVRDSSKKYFKGSETILLVEDEESVRKVAQTILMKSGYSILEARDGEEALRLLQKNNNQPIHLLLTDVVMPKMSGQELANQLKSKWPEMRVLYMSGYIHNPVIHQDIIKDKMAYIQKPFTPEALAQKVREILDEHLNSS